MVRVGRPRSAALPAGALTLGAALVTAALFAAACGRGTPQEVALDAPPADLTFADRGLVEIERQRRDADFRTLAESPVPEPQRKDFRAGYFPWSADFRMAARLVRYNDPKPLRLITTDGVERPAVRAGRLEFLYRGTRQKLEVYELRDSDPRHFHDLFLPFMDATTGRETYGAGRYINLDARPDGWVALDFNLAYLPSCAYGGTGFACPRTPPENRLPFPVTAGERLPEGAAPAH